MNTPDYEFLEALVVAKAKGFQSVMVPAPGGKWLVMEIDQLLLRQGWPQPVPGETFPGAVHRSAPPNTILKSKLVAAYNSASKEMRQCPPYLH